MENSVFSHPFGRNATTTKSNKKRKVGNQPMKKTNTLGTIEKVTLGEIEFADDSIQVWIDIKYVSSNLHSKILQAMEEAKLKTVETMRQLYGREWNKTEVKTLTLEVIARKGKALETNILVYFEEVEDADIFDSGEFKIDLSGYEMELKGLILKGITNKFF